MEEDNVFEIVKEEWAGRHESSTAYGYAIFMVMISPLIWVLEKGMKLLGIWGEKIEKAIKSEPEEEEMVELEVDMEDELIEKINIEANKLGITFDEFVQMAIRECLRNETKGKV